MSPKQAKALDNVVTLAESTIGGLDPEMFGPAQKDVATVKALLQPWYIWDSERETLEQADDRREQRVKALKLTGAEKEQLSQLRTATWDGNLISKTARTSLIELGLVVKYQGWQVVSQEGLAVLEIMEDLKA